MTATETWLLVMGVLAGLGALLHLYPERARHHDANTTTTAARTATWQVVALARALVAASLVALAVALAVSPAL